MQENISMTSGSIGKKMIYFAVPIMLGNLFQQLYNAVDSVIVGNFLGYQPLAAVTASASLMFMIVGLMMGFSMGAGVVISRYYGAGDTHNLIKAINTTIVFGLFVSALMTILGASLAEYIIIWMGTPESVVKDATIYLQIIFGGSVGIGMYNIFVGIMQAVGDNKHPLYYLIASSIINIILDLIFVGATPLGVAGAGLATIISQFISVFFCLRRIQKGKKNYDKNLFKVKPDKQMLMQIIKMAIPSGLQNSIIAIANVVVQTYINGFGDMAMAGIGAYGKVESFAFIPILSFNLAITTFISQNLGAKEYDRAKKGARFGIIASVTTAELIGVFMFALAPYLIAAFDRTPEVIQFGTDKTRTAALFFCFLAHSHAVASVLRGSGQSTLPMMIMVICWCVIRIIILAIAIPLTNDIQVIYWVYPATWALSSVIFLVLYKKSNWINKFSEKPKKFNGEQLKES